MAFASAGAYFRQSKDDGARHRYSMIDRLAFERMDAMGRDEGVQGTRTSARTCKRKYQQPKKVIAADLWWEQIWDISMKTALMLSNH